WKGRLTSARRSGTRFRGRRPTRQPRREFAGLTPTGPRWGKSTSGEERRVSSDFPNADRIAYPPSLILRRASLSPSRLERRKEQRHVRRMLVAELSRAQLQLRRHRFRSD